MHLKALMNFNTHLRLRLFHLGQTPASRNSIPLESLPLPGREKGQLFCPFLATPKIETVPCLHNDRTGLVHFADKCHLESTGFWKSLDHFILLGPVMARRRSMMTSC